MARGLNVGLPDVDGVHLSAEEYTDLLLTYGNGAEYRRSLICPCKRIDTNMARDRCPVCNGLGYVFPLSLRCSTSVLDTSRSQTFKWAAAGLMAQGQVTVTFPVSFLPAAGDLVLPDGEEHVVQEILWRDGARRVDPSMVSDLRARFVAGSDVPFTARPGRQRLLYPETTCIESVAYLVDESRLVLAESSSYRVEADGTWTWHGDFGPKPGDAWTVRYRAPAAYVVHGTGPLLRHEDDSVMPYRAVLQRLDRLRADDLR